MNMLNTIRETSLALVVLSSLALSACGGGGSNTPDPSRVLQESELYNPVTNPTGVVEQPGQTAVIGLQMNTSDLPPLANVASKGVEDLWFEVKDAQSTRIALDADMLESIDRLEIRDQSNALLATINASTSYTILSLAPGRYQALLYASAADPKPVPVFVQYATSQGSNAAVQAASTTEVVQPQGIFVWGSNLGFGRGCRGCNLSGNDYSGWDLRHSDITGADLAKANFTKANLSNADLSGANIDAANLSSADLRGARLRRAYFYLANLSGANLGGADLTEARILSVDFSGANLSEARLVGAKLVRPNLEGANLSGATFVDGRRCKEGSIGTCSL